MKRLQLVIACVSVAVLCATAVMAAPVPGTYKSTDLGGSLLLGRSSTSWDQLHGHQGINNVFNVYSWDGASPNTQWHAVCGNEPSQYTVTGTLVGGYGTLVYTSTFTGGSIWFGSGPWGSGNGTLGTTTVVTTVIFVAGTAVSSRANMQSSGTFTENNCTLTFLLANGFGAGQTDAPPPYNVKPATYPDFLDLSCNPTRVWGSWGDVSEITLMIQCVTPTRPHSWGLVRNLYR